MVYELRRLHLWPNDDYETGSWNLKYWTGPESSYLEQGYFRYEDGKEGFDLVVNAFDALAKLVRLKEAPTEPVKKVGLSFPFVMSEKEEESRLVLWGPEHGTKDVVWNMCYEKAWRWPFKPLEYLSLKAARNDFNAVARVFDEIARLAGLTDRSGCLHGEQGSWGKK